MGRPIAYSPEKGYMYQILCRYGNEAYEHCDYAVNTKDKNYLLNEYKLAYPIGYQFKTILLPKKYHPQNND